MIFDRRFASARNVPDMHAASLMCENGSITVIRVRVISHACRLDLRGCARHDAGVGATNIATFPALRVQLIKCRLQAAVLV